MPEAGFLFRSNADLKYAVYIPRDTDPAGLPVILFLHGRGETGTDGIKQTAIGLGHAVRMQAERWPFLIVMPQKTVTDALWANYRFPLNGMLREVESEFKPSPTKRYITGLSQGGRGTWDLANQLDWQFAAAAPVCGWTEPKDAAERFATMPLWAFHGQDDPVVDYRSTHEAVQLLQSQGAPAKYTLYPGIGHNSWDKAYMEEDLANWFLQHEL